MRARTPSIEADDPAPGGRRAGLAMLLLSCVAFVLLAWAWCSKANAHLWALAAAAWAIHDAVALLCRRFARREFAAGQPPLAGPPGNA